MYKRMPLYFVVVVSILSFGLIASGCSKKQVVKEDAGGKPVMEAKKDQGKSGGSQEVEKKAGETAPQATATTLAVTPKAEAKAEQKIVSLDLSSLRIHFAFDDYSLSPKAKQNLSQIASWMSKNPEAKIMIQGNTCDIGNAEYNLALGDRRAISAKTYLQNLGINPARVSTISYGEERPSVPNTDEANRAKNRRDEFSKGN